MGGCAIKNEYFFIIHLNIIFYDKKERNLDFLISF